MTSSEPAQLALFFGLLGLLTPLVGRYLTQVLRPDGRTWLDPVLRPVERLTYRMLGVAAVQEQDWKQYASAVLAFSLVSSLVTYTILRTQHLLPLNPAALGPVAPHLAFNIAVSFATNTNWQSYSGETTLSYFSQMVGLVLHHFGSAATGIGVAAALVRALARPGVPTLGSFWVDLVRITVYLLLPASLVLALVLVSQGAVQNFAPSTPIRPIEAAAGPEARQSSALLAQGPAASQVAIKMIGTNGGGFFNANAAHPFENPTSLSNVLQMLALLAIASGLTHHLGRAIGNPAHGWTVWAVMMGLLIAGTLACSWAESSGNPIHHQLGLAPLDGNMEGKEVRFGIVPSALFATATTAASCGAVNAMHDSFTPLGGLVPLFNMQLGEIIFGGVGAGLYGMLLFVLLAVFIAGLMVGRTPEYLGRKIQAYEVKMAMLALLALCAPILGFSAWAAASEWGRAGLGNAGPHGLTEILYAFSSAAGNNGSAFAGLNTNTPAYNTTLALAMLLGRFLVILPVLALAGSLARKRVAPAGPGTLPVSGPTFALLLVATIVLVGALNFLPALALGPGVEHFLMRQGRLF